METLKPAPPVRAHSSVNRIGRNIARIALRIVSGREVAKEWRKTDVTVNLSRRKCLISACFKHDTATFD
ncbi:hypothetical protein MM326_06795 [Alkalihalobacillus sp. LMS6]|uniref:hypothetical protein n=1 Tax=Alkalihalobacillus sp. LMS6 TaxID=2924034 RepID=UPI0020D0F0A4|nr:hypothetical protein [Alkalihalobacillus sp. LMS6]UTR07715.1 hypothetical protein MM326_06795 [Alkalihalobacillus sp. LMS6]